VARLECVAQKPEAGVGTTEDDQISQTLKACYSVQAEPDRLKAVVGADLEGFQSVLETAVVEQDREQELVSRLAKCCAAQVVTTEVTDIDVEIDQYRTVPPSNFGFVESPADCWYVRCLLDNLNFTRGDFSCATAVNAVRRRFSCAFSVLELVYTLWQDADD
jgi:hypothetical protein